MHSFSGSVIIIEEEAISETPVLSPSQAEFSKKVTEFSETFLRPIYLANLDSVLKDVPSPEEEFQALQNEFATRRDLSQIIIKYVQGIRKSEEPIPLEIAMRFFGLQNAKAFLIAYKLADTMPLKIFERSKEGTTLAQPIASLIRFAPQTLLRFGEDSRYKQVAYASGLLFDLLYLKLSETADGQGALKKFTEVLTAYHERACAEASFAVELARFRKKLPLERHIVSVCLIEAASRAAMFCIYPDFQSTWATWEKEGKPDSLRFLLEREKYGGEHWMLGIILANAFSVLEEVTAALSGIALPMALQGQKYENQRDLVSLCYLARKISQNKKPGYTNGKFIGQNFRGEVTGFQLEIPQAEFDGIVKKLP